MSSRTRRLALGAMVLGFLLLLSLIFVSASKHPVALIRIVDAAGRPVAGAVVRPQGLRTKAGPYVSGWYAWPLSNGVPDRAMLTDQDGCAEVPYPKYVFERIETGTLVVNVDHDEYVPQRPERVVDARLPAGAPALERLAEIWDRLRQKKRMARPDAIVLQRGTVFRMTAGFDAARRSDGRLYAQLSGFSGEDTNFWIRSGPGVLMTRRLAVGPHTIRAIQFASESTPWFSDVIRFVAVTNQTNELSVELKPGVTVRGQLDSSVPRPVSNGRVVANVWPLGYAPKDNPPTWHGWSPVRDDGRFEIASLPAGDLEIVALCNGYVSTNGPGQFQMRYPQRHLLAAKDLEIVVGMEPTARLEVDVTDSEGRPLKDVRVMTWPNVRYGEWAATILMSDCYNSSALLLDSKPSVWRRELNPDFEGVSDSSGRAIIPNLPATVREFSVSHPKFTLPAKGTPGGGMSRQGTVTLAPGQTNNISIRLEAAGQSVIRHY